MFALTNKRRNEKGNMGIVTGMAVFIPTALSLGVLAVDTGHPVAVLTQLQNAADAGALAGALSLRDGPGNSDYYAVQIAGQNTADGSAVSSSSANTSVTSTTDTSGNPEVVKVTAQMTVNNTLAKLLSLNTQTLTAISDAYYYSSINQVPRTQVMPIAVSIDQYPNGPDGPGKPLNQLNIGDSLSLVIKPNDMPDRNAGWTSLNEGSANTDTYVSMLNHLLGNSLPDNSYPPLVAGQSQINMDSGLNNGVGLDSKFASALEQAPSVVLAVIQGSQFNGSATVIGFVTVQINSIDHGDGSIVIDSTVVKGVVPNATGGQLPSTGNTTNDTALAQISAGTVMLANSAP